MKQTTRYPWADAPENAVAAIANPDGNITWIAQYSDGFEWAFTSRYTDPIDWQDSLELRPTEPQAEPLTIGEAMQRNAEAAARLLEAPSYREQLRAEFAGRIYAAYVQKLRDVNVLEVAKMAVVDADALLNELYPSPQNTDK